MKSKTPRTSPKKRPKPTVAAKLRDRIVGLVWAEPSRLKAHPENWRRHPDEQRSAFRAVLAEIGIADAAVAFVSDGKARAVMLALATREERAAWLASYTGKLMLIDGHLRAEEIAQPIPTLVLDVGPEDARKALATHDAVTALAETKRGALLALAQRAAFSSDTITRALAVAQQRYELPLPLALPPPPRLDDDADEEEPVIPTDALVKKWGTALGQLWIVPSLTTPGREHRLLCGDCRDPENVKRLHDRARVALGLHDPPYGIAIVSKTGSTLGDGPPIAQRAPGNGERTRGGSLGNGEQARSEWTRRGKFAPIEGDAADFDDARALLVSAGRVVLWGANNYPTPLPPSNEWIAWDKKATVDGGSIGANSFSDFELAFVSPRAGQTGHSRIIRHLWSGLIRASERKEKRLHPTQKPIAVQQQIVEWYSKPGDIVADWYMGAGAVLIACEKSGRIGHGMDIAPAYLAATLERLSARGLTPKLVQ